MPRYKSEAAYSSLMLVDSQDVFSGLFDDGYLQRKRALGSLLWWLEVPLDPTEWLVTGCSFNCPGFWVEMLIDFSPSNLLFLALTSHSTAAALISQFRMTRLDLDPRYYEEVLWTKTIRVITRVLQVTALLNTQRVSATLHLSMSMIIDGWWAIYDLTSQ